MKLQCDSVEQKKKKWKLIFHQSTVKKICDLVPLNK